MMEDRFDSWIRDGGLRKQDSCTAYSCSIGSSVNMMRLIWDYNRFGNHPEELIIMELGVYKIKNIA